MRKDADLAYMLQYEHVAWYENGKVSILDRRVYPNVIKFVICTDYHEVAKAIKDMVTQSGGPFLAAGMGMALAAYECRDFDSKSKLEYLEKAAYLLSHARPTTSAKMQEITYGCLEVAKKSIEIGTKVDQSVFEYVFKRAEERYGRSEILADFLTDLFPQKATVLTQCFGETIVGMMLKKIKEKNKDIKLICAETRPYFQGARLTASVAFDQGFDVTVVSDNMIAYCMNKGMIDIFTSAADVITCDGHVVNKIGTFQIALLCKNFKIPYYATGNPDKAHIGIDSVQIEQRNPEFVLEAMGVRTAMKGVHGLYPAFDITPPELVTKIVTDKGTFNPAEVNSFFDI